MARGVADLRITEIFVSLQGESKTVGLPTVFVRLTGCPLRCTYCDTAYAFSGGTQMSVNEIVDEVCCHSIQDVTVTGGEPLAQAASLNLTEELCDRDLCVAVETSGAVALDGLDPRVRIVMDLKTPSSGEQSRNRYENITQLDCDDEIKFVVSDRADYEWAKDIMRTYDLTERVAVLLSPNHAQLSPRDLGEWILADRLAVRMQIQLHKYLWGDEPGR